MLTLYFLFIIILVVLVHTIGKFLCLKIFKTNRKSIRQQLHWKRYVYEFSGSLFLFIVAFVIFSSRMMYDGKVYLANDSLTYGIEVNEAGEAIGFEDGDKIISINGEKLKEFKPSYFIVDIIKEKNEIKEKLKGPEFRFRSIVDSQSQE